MLSGMILEMGVLDIRDGAATEFEAAFGEAKKFIAASEGFLGIQLQRCVDTQNRYLLLVRWETVEAHTEGFRGSPAFEQWRAAVHHFFDPKPNVEHYELVDAIE